MTEAVVVGLFAGVCSIVDSVINGNYPARRNNQEVFAKIEKEFSTMREEMRVNQAVMEEKVDTLSTRVDKHNGVVDRTYKLEKEVSNIETRLELEHVH